MTLCFALRELPVLRCRTLAARCRAYVFAIMTFEIMLALGLAVIIFVYLLVALLRPERF